MAAEHAQPAAKLDAPQLRTLLLTDLCDSTELVERIGDGAAAELFREHDHLVVQLQQQWRGRLIDRSDGLLLLFERPIDGLGFALDYAQGLLALGKRRSVVLRARQGLHVGEVLTWRNSDEAVRIGAKPLEVEGLAKPTAARLMSMARPGQILLSAVAESLTHRAARELGTRAERLLWKSHGRWRFKGVPTAMEIYEVGEVALAPLRMPQHSPKAWRDIPLWRRPAALLTEVLAVVALVVGGLIMTRPVPAIAFAERDWVIVGDLQNRLNDTRFDGAVEAALRTSLEQSRFVNVIPDVRAQGTLAMMRRSGQRIDRRVGAELAERLGARALLLPTISESSGKIRLDLEIVNPQTMATVLSLSDARKGGDQVVKSVGEVGESLRKALGEQPDLIERSSAPLEQVTTRSIDALRSFTLGQKAYALKDLASAEQHFLMSLRIDPQFAMARIGLARVAYSRADFARAQSEMKHALSGAAKLTMRERLYADAQLALLLADKDYIQKWSALSDLYPDFDIAAFNAATGMRATNDYAGMLKFSRRAATPQGVTLPLATQYRAIANAGTGHLEKAEADCRKVEQLGSKVASVECAMFQAAGFKIEPALSTLRPVADEQALFARERAAAEITVLADAGRWEEAEGKAKNIIADVEAPSTSFDWLARTTALAVLAKHSKKTVALAEAEKLLALAERALPRSVARSRESIAIAALYAGYVAAGYPDSILAKRAIDLTDRDAKNSPHPLLKNFADVVRSRIEISTGHPQKALALLEQYSQPWALTITRVELIHVHRALGNDVQGLLRDSRAPASRGRVYAEWAPERPPLIDRLTLE